MPKLAPPPPVTLESWRTLLSLTAGLATLAPWKFAYDRDVVGLIDPLTGEKRIGSVLGNAGQVFAIVIYRRAGLRWILSLLDDVPDDLEDLNQADGMDCLKVELVPKRELTKEDLVVLKSTTFKPAGKGAVWPQFRSADPGWHPWYINQAEADQLLADLPRLLAFYKMFEEHPELFLDRAPTDIPFLPVTLPDRPLSPNDLDWQPLLPPPGTDSRSFQPADEKLDKLRVLKRLAESTFEFDCAFLAAGSFIENGRPCFGRFCLMVESRRGMVLGMSMQSGGLTPGEAAGRGLVESLLKAGCLPTQIVIGGSRFQNVLQPFCDKLQIKLTPASSLPALEQAVALLEQQMAGRIP